MLSRDDLYNLIQLSSHLDGFVKHVTLYPDLVCIINLPEVIIQFNLSITIGIFFLDVLGIADLMKLKKCSWTLPNFLS
jgi:hypothetical protein